MASRKPPVETSTIATIAPGGDHRLTLQAIRDRIAFETDDLLWAKHKRECVCTCGMADPRALVALVKELRAVIAEIESLPAAKEESTSDQLALRRAARIANAAGR